MYQSKETAFSYQSIKLLAKKIVMN